jgi:acetyltransferase
MVFPVNPQRSSVLGIKAYPTLAAVPERVDLAIIATPASTVPALITECVEAGVKGAIIISSGFKESGAEGAALEQQVRERVRQGKLRVIGPNCLGVMNPLTGLNATITSKMAEPGQVGFIIQSGGNSVLDWSLDAHVGFSAFVSLGSMVDVGWGDLIDYLGSDPQTRSIVIYMEMVGDARSFLSAAREVALRKPIIILKSGRTQAAVARSGMFTGSYEVFEAACRRSGVLLVNHLDELFSMAGVLAKQPRPRGPHLTILTNTRAPGILAADALVSGGGALTELAPQTLAALNQLLPAHWSHNNPVDILGDADPERYAQALEIAAQDPNSDGVLLILTPQAPTDPTLTAEQVKRYAITTGKPLLASWMGGAAVASGTTLLNRASIPTFPYPDTAAQVFNYMWRYKRNLDSLYETPQPSVEFDKGGRNQALAEKLLETAREAGRTLLTESESRQLLATYGIPTVETPAAANSPMSALDGYELLVGSSIDPQFGPVLCFGWGGQLAEVCQDKALALPPLTTTLARRMMEQTRIFTLLKGARGRPPVDLTTLEHLLVRFSYLVIEQRWIKEIEINPLVASPERLLALDARMVLHGPEISGEMQPRLAIRPYPTQYVQRWTLRNGTPITLRPIRPEDEPLMVRFHETLSARSVYLRWLHMLHLNQRIAHQEMIRMCFIDYDRQMALVVDYENPLTGQHEIIGVGSLIKEHGTKNAETALLVTDQFQRHGLGTELLRQLIQIGRDEHLQRVTGDILPENEGMQAICKKLGFHMHYSREEQVVKVEREL